MNLRFGAVCWGQYTDWPALLEAGRTADRLGFDSLWSTDHLYAIHGRSPGPIFEGWTTVAAWAAVTRRARLGLLVAANTVRAPALTAKIATTLDHVSGGRAILGIGAGWHEAEHLAFGLDFGSGPPERLRWLDEGLAIIRGMLDGTEIPAVGPHYKARSPLNRPAPFQARLPILVGGGGERVTLRLVAKWADMNNVGGGIAAVRRKEGILRRHCEDLGRDPDEIERTAGIGIVVIRDKREDALRAFQHLMDRNGGADIAGQLVGTAADVAEILAPYQDAGYHHLIAEFPAPHDRETMERLIGEVKPMLGGA